MGFKIELLDLIGLLVALLVSSAIGGLMLRAACALDNKLGGGSFSLYSVPSQVFHERC